jgi:hypothetical protein
MVSERLQKDWNYSLASKEALLYYRILHEAIDDPTIFSNICKSPSL